MADINFVKVGGRMHSTSEDSNPANNHVTSGANEIYDDHFGKKQDVINREHHDEIADRYTKNEVYNKSETYSKDELNNLITTPNQKYVTLSATQQTTAATDVLPQTGEADTIYRIANWDSTQYDPGVYSEYAWNGTSYVFLSVKDLGHQLLAIETLANGDIVAYYGEEVADDIYMEENGDIVVEQEINI